MAGIGFELKKLFRRKGILARIVAVGYTGMITTGPLLLGFVFLLMISWLGRAFGLSGAEVDGLLAMVAYALVFSQVLYGLFSMVATRHVSDMLYSGEDGRVVPSLVGVLATALPLGGIAYGVFLCFSGIGFELGLLNEILFLELVAVWLEMGYLTAVKDYKGVLGVYAVSIVASVAVAWALCALGGPSVGKLLGSVCIGYGLMMILDMRLLATSFPGDGGAFFSWMAWADRHPLLVVIGICTCVGLFAHLVIDWANPAESQQVIGLFYSSPGYDIPAFYAVLSMIPTTIMFVASTEVEFYPVYRRYFDLLNGTGSISQIDAAQAEMVAVMDRELSRLARTQLLFTIAIVVFGTQLLDMLPLGFTTSMNDRFCVLCVGYGVYAVGNVVSLMLMYFSDYKGAARAAVVFACCVVATSVVSNFLPAGFLGYGFAVSSMLYYLVAWVELRRYVRGLPGVVLLEQPLVARKRAGFFTRLGARLDRAL